ncbi:TraR/DksA C4-type zinc finger protein [Hahella ganghwensis]|uniref:TraR/DksA C4-type zinc finger protein n=1 Tax=Hahella ganghwensis TaxID=286420 RepID=UPI000378AE49|nr:TraR/DksA C4-type zinc finger protein [Hahella ganghwensis]
MAIDHLDTATELQDLLNTTALRHQLSQSVTHMPSLKMCADCDADIPEARQRLGGVTRCVECEGYFQRERQREQQRGRR